MSEINTGPDSVSPRHVRAGIDDVPDQNCAVSWAAVLGGAVGAVALSLLLVFLGMGLGFSVVSPWTMQGIDASTFGFAAILWVSFMQLAASGMGGYLAGRLRTKWTSVHAGELGFRDSAHGFLTWSVATLFMAVLMTSVVGSIVGGAVSAGAEVAGQAASAAGTVAESTADGDSESGDAGDTVEYFVDSLFRDDFADATPVRSEGAQNGEVMRIFAQALRTGSLSQEDERHVGRLIAQRTDLSQREAEQRVSEGFDQVQTTLDEYETTARESADEAREASAYAAFWMFIALLLGAIAASLMAVLGGRRRNA